MSKTQWGLFPPSLDWGLPNVRLPYNVYTGMGLGQLQKGKKNFLNFICGKPGRYYGTTLLFTTKSALQAALELVCQYLKQNGYDAVIVLENEPLNANRISNTSPDLYIQNLSWAKPVCDKYGIPLAQGATMMPAQAGIYKATLSRNDSNAFLAYMGQNGFYVGGRQAVKDSLKVIDYSAANGILNNFHWQEEHYYLSDILDTVLPAHGDNWIANENAIRIESVDSVVKVTTAINESIVSNAIVYDTVGLGGNAILWTEEMKAAFLQLV